MGVVERTAYVPSAPVVLPCTTTFPVNTRSGMSSSMRSITGRTAPRSTTTVTTPSRRPRATSSTGREGTSAGSGSGRHGTWSLPASNTRRSAKSTWACSYKEPSGSKLTGAPCSALSARVYRNWVSSTSAANATARTVASTASSVTAFALPRARAGTHTRSRAEGPRPRRKRAHGRADPARTGRT